AADILETRALDRIRRRTASISSDNEKPTRLPDNVTDETDRRTGATQYETKIRSSRFSERPVCSPAVRAGASLAGLGMYDGGRQRKGDGRRPTDPLEKPGH